MHEVELKTGRFVQQLVQAMSSSLTAGECEHLQMGFITTGVVIDHTYGPLLKAAEYKWCLPY